ncbi:MAG: DUF1343 domain-containing protein [Planctomycetaceae bacterium]|nr:DUF1343 domain-containing protein [Planctomycetaceae bacterium]
MNQASVDSRPRYACDLLAAAFPDQLKALFSPQHGLWGEEQANMIESAHSRYEPLDLPVYSLYSETRRPTPAMLRGLDCLVVDLQDVGTRVYTFIWTVQQCLLACAAAGVRVVILDRPNPLGGHIVEGPMLDPPYQSFVGGWPIPLRHGLTLGELALLINDEQQIGGKIDVVPMEGWRREMLWSDLSPVGQASRLSRPAGQASPTNSEPQDKRDACPTSRPWIWPSPNMPRVETALLYPGQVLLEGTNVSEGRGTTLPFEVAGAPFIDPHRLVAELEQYDHPGLTLRPIRFVPTFDKWQGQPCGGGAFHIIDPRAVRSVATSVALLAAARKLYPRDFAWLPPPYEYEHINLPIDILFGSPRLRERLANSEPLVPAEIGELTAFDQAAWHRRTTRFRLY